MPRFRLKEAGHRALSLMWPWGTLALLTLAVYLWGLGGFGLLDPEGPSSLPSEGRVAEIAREMIESGDLVTPRLNYVETLEGPLVCWLTVGAFTLAGETEFAARLVPLLLGLGGCGLTFLLARRVTGSRRVGGLSAMVLATSLLWFLLSRVNTADRALTFFVTLALLGYRLWLGDEDERESSPALTESLDTILLAPAPRRGLGLRLTLPLALFHGGMALATLSKGIAGVLLPAGVAVLHLLLRRGSSGARWRPLLRLFSPLGVALYFLIAAPWCWAVCRANPGLSAAFFSLENPLLRLTAARGRPEPFWFFVPVLLAAFVPWTGMAFDVLHAARGKWSIVGRDDGLFLGLWFGVPFLLFSVLPVKQIPCALPCMPPMAVLMGAAMEMTLQRSRGSRWMIRRFIGLNALFLLPLALAGGIWPLLSSRPEVRALAGALRPLSVCLAAFWAASLLLLRRRRRQVPALLCILALGVLLASGPALRTAARRNSSRDAALMALDRLGDGDSVVAYQDAMPGLSFYLRRRVVTAEAGEGADGQWFLTGAQLRRLWNGPSRVLLVARRRGLEPLRRALGREPLQVGEAARDILFTNF